MAHTTQRQQPNLAQADPQPSPQTPRSLARQEANAFVRFADEAYEQAAVPLTAALIVLYVAPLDARRAWLLVPLACAWVPLLACQLALFCHRRGLLRWPWRTLRDFLSGAFIRVALGIENLRQSKPGRLLLWLALANLGLALANLGLAFYLLYHNVDLLHVARNLAHMVWTLVTALRDPVALLESFEALLRSLAVYRALEHTRLQYVARVVGAIEQGSLAVLAEVLFVTGFLVFLAFVAYVVSAAFRFVGQTEEEEIRALESPKRT